MLPPGSKPFIVYDWGFDATNSFLGYERIFTDFLLANPKAIGQIRVFANTHKSFQEEKAGLMSKLSSVPTKQLKFLWNRNDSGGAGEWKIIPPKK